MRRIPVKDVEALAERGFTDEDLCRPEAPVINRTRIVGEPGAGNRIRALRIEP
jgi:hypothetical protein